MTLTQHEQQCIGAFRQSGECWPARGAKADDEAWIQFGLASMLYATRVVRKMRVSPLGSATTFKEDASPVTTQEHQIEKKISSQLTQFCSEATFLGEECGGTVQSKGMSIAVDPVDGTWALLNHLGSCAAVLAAYRDGVPFLGIIANPATGEIGYTVSGRSSRLIQLELGGASDIATDMPLDRAKRSSILINVHPSRRAMPFLEQCMNAWQSNEIQMVRMEGGSPSAALLDVAKGSFVYINVWDKRPADPFDLAAGVMMVRNAGGRVVDLAGRDIDEVTHAGAFVAGTDRVAIEKILEIAGSGGN